MSARPAYVGTALAVAAATGVYGISFGALAVAAGLDVPQACVLSALMFTGGSQFALVAVVAAGGTGATAAGNALLLGARNTAYGIAVAPILDRIRSRPGRALATHLVIDETTAVSTGQADPDDQLPAFLWTGIALWSCWNLGTLVGAIAGDRIGDPARWGLDAMFPAAFVALLAPQLRRCGAPRVAVVGAAIALALTPFAPVGVPVLASVLALVLVLRDGASPAEGER